jgi:hypothetical protein
MDDDADLDRDQSGVTLPRRLRAKLKEVAARNGDPISAQARKPTKLKPAKTATNPQGAGRPKGSGQRKSKPRQTDNLEDKIVAFADQGMTSCICRPMAAAGS